MRSSERRHAEMKSVGVARKGGPALRGIRRFATCIHKPFRNVSSRFKSRSTFLLGRPRSDQKMASGPPRLLQPVVSPCDTCHSARLTALVSACAALPRAPSAYDVSTLPFRESRSGVYLYDTVPFSPHPLIGWICASADRVCCAARVMAAHKPPRPERWSHAAALAQGKAHHPICPRSKPRKHVDPPSRSLPLPIVAGPDAPLT